jgi:hypothetical protein
VKNALELRRQKNHRNTNVKNGKGDDYRPWPLLDAERPGRTAQMRYMPGAALVAAGPLVFEVTHKVGLLCSGSVACLERLLASARNPRL